MQVRPGCTSYQFTASHWRNFRKVWLAHDLTLARGCCHKILDEHGLCCRAPERGKPSGIDLTTANVIHGSLRLTLLATPPGDAVAVGWIITPNGSVNTITQLNPSNSSADDGSGSELTIDITPGAGIHSMNQSAFPRRYQAFEHSCMGHEGEGITTPIMEFPLCLTGFHGPTKALDAYILHGLQKPRQVAISL